MFSYPPKMYQCNHLKLMSLANSFLLNTEMCNNSLACLKKNHPQKIRIIKQIVNLLRLLISTAAPSIILHSPCTSNFEQWPNSSSLIRGELAHHWFTAVPPMQRNLPALCGCEQYSRRVCMYISCLWLWEHDRELLHCIEADRLKVALGTRTDGCMDPIFRCEQYTCSRLIVPARG
jgi:hypothetical protein